MPKLTQHQEQLTIMIEALKRNLHRVRTTSLQSLTHQNDLSNLTDDERNKAIYLCGATIIFYQELDKLLKSTEFIDFFNKKLTYLLDETKCEDLFNQLTSPYQFEIPSQLTAKNELQLMIKFAAIIVLEAQKAIDAQGAHEEFLRKTSLWLGCLSILGLLSIGIVFPFLPLTTLVIIPLALTGSLLLAMLITGLILDRLQFESTLNSLEIFARLQEVKHDQDVMYVRTRIITEIPDISSDVRDISDLLPASEPQTNALGKMHALFFKQPEKIMLSKADFENNLSATFPLSPCIQDNR